MTRCARQFNPDSEARREPGGKEEGTTTMNHYRAAGAALVTGLLPRWGAGLFPLVAGADGYYAAQ